MLQKLFLSLMFLLLVNVTSAFGVPLPIPMPDASVQEHPTSTAQQTSQANQNSFGQTLSSLLGLSGFGIDQGTFFSEQQTYQTNQGISVLMDQSAAQFSRQQRIWRENQERRRAYEHRRKLGSMEMRPALIYELPTTSSYSIQYNRSQEIFRQNQQQWQYSEDQWKAGNLMMAPAPIYQLPHK